MTKANALTKDDLTRFVRGEKPWRMLLSRGVDIEFVDKKVKATSTGEPVVSPTMADVASGFVRFRSDPVVLREWASVILALGELDLDQLEGDSEGEILKAALWDASFGETVSDKAWGSIERLAGRAQA